MSEPDKHSTVGRPKRQLNLFDTICMIVGIIIGAGIYETTPSIAENTSSAATLLGIWCVGGLIALVGALCYAELSTTYPEEGGDYVFLSRSYGRRIGFLFAWAEYWIIRPGNVGMMSFVFARFANDIFPLRLVTGKSHLDFVAYATTAIVILTALNLLGVRAGKTTQNILTTIKVGGLIAIVLVGMFFVPVSVESSIAQASSSGEGSLSLALILVLFTYGGWNEISYVAAEVKNPTKNITRSLIIGTTIITVVYVCVNFAFLRGLGHQATGQSQAVAADLLRLRFGDSAGGMISVLVCLSCLGAINGMLFTGSRVFFAAGADHHMISWLGEWNERWDCPLRALLLQLSATLALVIGFGWYEHGFTRLLNFVTPVYWLFAAGVASSLFILRRVDPLVERPVRVALYPFTPMLFFASCAFLFYSSLKYASQNYSAEATWTLTILVAGIAVSLLPSRKPRASVD